MEALFGAKLQGKSGEVSTCEALAGKTAVGIYFSAHWCPPCRGFTPKLAEYYEKDLKGKGLEVVFVSSDKDEDQFNSYYGEQPWLALPYSDRDKKNALSKKFKVQGIPSFVILDGEGKLITTEGRGAVQGDPEGKDLPWKPKSMKEVMEGLVLMKESTTVDVKSAFADKKAIGLYFSAHWCPPCRGFTPKLAEWYKKDLQGQGLEIVFVSSDKDEKQFADYYGEQPWLALDYKERKTKDELSKACKVEGIPSFVILDPSDYSIINAEGREAVTSDPAGKELPWKPKPVRNLSGGPGDINETPTLIVFCETSDAAEKAAIEATLTTLAVKVIDEAKAKDEDPEMNFVIATEAAGLSGRIRKMTSLEALPPQPHEHPMKEAEGAQWGCDGCGQSGAGKKRYRCTEGCDWDYCGDCYEKAQSGGASKVPPKVILIDIPSDGAFYVAPEGEVTPASVEKFIADFKAKSLERKQLSRG